MGKRYLFFITGMPMGGAERVMSTLANQFVKHGDTIRLVTMKTPECVYELDPRVELVGAYAQLNVTSVRQIIRSVISVLKGITFYKKQIKEYKPDGVLSFLTYTNIIAVLFGRQKNRIPVVISERCDPLQRNRIIAKLVRKIYPHADCIVCQSKTIEEYFKSVNTNIHTAVIPNPINSESINTEEFRTRKKTIIAVGRLSKQKNYDLLIRSFDKIKMEFPDYHIEIYGKGPEEESIQKLIDELGLCDKVFLMGTKNNVMKEEANASLYVMSSDFEGYPNALVEAMASGLPVISTDFPSGVAHELIEDGVNGFTVPVRDVNMLADKMRAILSDTDLQKSMSERNTMIRETLNEEYIYQIWKRLFENIGK